jgi:hypothetical protein
MYGYLYMQLGPPQIVNQAHVLSSLILRLYRYTFYTLSPAWHIYDMLPDSLVQLTVAHIDAQYFSVRRLGSLFSDKQEHHQLSVVEL